MLWPVVDHVAALAEGREVGVRVVSGVVVSMSRGRHDVRHPHPGHEIVEARRAGDRLPLLIALGAQLTVPPAAIRETVDFLPVWPSAPLAAAASPPKADHRRELRPVDGVEEAVLGPDRHGSALCHPA